MLSLGSKNRIRKSDADEQYEFIKKKENMRPCTESSATESASAHKPITKKSVRDSLVHSAKVLHACRKTKAGQRTLSCNDRATSMRANIFTYMISDNSHRDGSNKSTRCATLLALSCDFLGLGIFEPNIHTMLINPTTLPGISFAYGLVLFECTIQLSLCQLVDVTGLP